MSSKKKSIRRDLPKVFVQLNYASSRLLKISMTNAQIIHEIPSDAASGSQTCRQLICLKKQMQQQLTEMRTHLQTRGTSNEHVDSSFNVSLSAVCDPLEDEICSAKNKELLLKRLQTCKALMNSLKRDPNQCLSVAAVMRHTMDNNKQIWALARSNRELEKQVVDIRKRRIDIQIRQQELFRKLTNSGKTKYKIRETQMKTQMKEREILETLSNEVVILQEVFQRCVMGAQVNWAEDPLLTSLLLRMRDPRFC